MFGDVEGAFPGVGDVVCVDVVQMVVVGEGVSKDGLLGVEMVDVGVAQGFVLETPATFDAAVDVGFAVEEAVAMDGHVVVEEGGIGDGPGGVEVVVLESHPGVEGIHQRLFGQSASPVEFRPEFS